MVKIRYGDHVNLLDGRIINHSFSALLTSALVKDFLYFCEVDKMEI